MEICGDGTRVELPALEVCGDGTDLEFNGVHQVALQTYIKTNMLNFHFQYTKGGKN